MPSSPPADPAAERGSLCGPVSGEMTLGSCSAWVRTAGAEQTVRPEQHRFPKFRSRHGSESLRISVSDCGGFPGTSPRSPTRRGRGRVNVAGVSGSWCVNVARVSGSWRDRLWVAPFSTAPLKSERSCVWPH